MAPSANYIEEETLASLVALPVASFEKEQLKLQVEFTASELSSPELSASELASPLHSRNEALRPVAQLAHETRD
jgi:hypothetical protein